MAFQQLKKYLSHPPIMSSPEMDEVLFAYIVMAPHAVSLSTTRESHPSGGAWYTKTSPLNAYSCRPNSASAQGHTLKC